MIYLIGGPPKCGKTTLSKKMSRELGIPWISADTLQVIARKYMNKKDAVKKFPWSAIRRKNKSSNDITYGKYTAKEIVELYNVQAEATHDAIDMFSVCEITDGNDYIVEGYQVTPKLVATLSKKYGANNFKTVFLARKDTQKFIEDCKKSTTPNDWILTNTKQPETYLKIANMISEYSSFFEKESKKYGYRVFNMDQDFHAQLDIIKSYLK